MYSGLLKPEFLGTNGVYIGLAPKSYILTQYDENGQAEIKKGAKGKFFFQKKAFFIFNINLNFFSEGVPRCVKLTENEYRQCLFEGTPHDVPFNALILNSDKEMSRISTTKRGLSDAITKIFVHDDKVSCSPLRKNNVYI